MDNSAVGDTGSRQLYQAVRCGGLRVAFPYGWASTIVETFSVTPVPKAPAWLLGATNIDGRIFPVVDLAHYGAHAVRTQRTTKGNESTKPKRLLIGGVQDEKDDGRLAIAFDGLPEQIGRTGTKLLTSPSGEASTGLTDGTVELARGERYALVNVDRLLARLSAELSAL
jgi:chemotaxis signal transduction protein